MVRIKNMTNIYRAVYTSFINRAYRDGKLARVVYSRLSFVVHNRLIAGCMYVCIQHEARDLHATQTDAATGKQRHQP